MSGMQRAVTTDQTRPGLLPSSDRTSAAGLLGVDMEILLAARMRWATLEQLLNGNISLHGNCLTSRLNEANAIFSCPAPKGNRPMVALI
jgi:hypothetical protein